MSKTIVCIQCPLSCNLEVKGQGEGAIITGNKCPRGLKFAREEMVNPRRTLTSTVRTVYSDFPRLPVRTRGEIPLASIFPAMQEINDVLVRERLRPGEIVLPRLAGTDVALVATDDMTIMGDWRDQQSAACH